MTFKRSILSILLMMWVFAVHAAPTKANTAAEIQYLLAFIAHSDCIFIRNDTEYDGKEARNHIEKKYNYLKSRLNSADDFIAQAASKSSFSGRAYRVKCGESYLTTEKWLLAALNDYRSTH